MDRGNILSGGAFRVTVYATLTLLIVFMLTGILGYRFLQRAQFEHAQDRGAPVIESFRKIHAEGGDQAIAATAKTISDWVGPTSRLLSIYSSSGESLGGTFAIQLPPQGWHVRSIANATDPTHPREYYLTSVKIGSYTFVVGEDLAPLRRIEAIFVRTLMVIGAFLSLSFVALGYLTSKGIQSKLEQMGDALQRFAAGAMAVRLPTSRSNDQVDRVARSMNAQLDRLSRLMAETKTNAASIAHDLKRPLGRATLGVERALDATEKGELPQEALEDVLAELSNLNAIFEAILRISRIDAGHEAKLRDDVDLATLAEDLAETYQVVAEESDQSLTLSLPDHRQVPVRGDAGMLAQMLANLLQNAVNHGASGNRIEIRVDDAASGPVLEISDTGPGIPEADRARIFDAFYRAEAARSTPGNGLGLTLVKSVADRHGARIRLADNAPGLRVCIRFPKP
ncbi:HAMP domain-containing sensor histidine kinase [Phaeobacter sp. HF9A]|uniref:sensor histidine kinase n=1 Tax=Phaeobacter sp. HF9A TaxID=2721561 RepID=UPI001431A744|nr:HAMP domain-containing sensor histidine kinase [Phaeobacter sp. HF9A]NIZ12739.1 HAMP domain-containing histidine kinase [Phaeobacter sp. HF9A]